MRTVTRSVLGLPVLLTVVAAIVAGIVISPAAGLALVLLTILEIVMAADTSVPMAGIASRLPSPARRLFLSVGLVAGVLAMRLALPPAAVAVTSSESPADAATEALLDPSAFAVHLEAARPGLAAFGAVFIWYVFSEYLFNVDGAARRPWLGRAESILASVTRPRIAATGTAAVAATTMTLLAPEDDRAAIAIGSLIGFVGYAIVKLIAHAARSGEQTTARMHLYASTVVFERGLTVFMLFEILDGVYTLSSTSTGLGLLEQAAVAACGVGIGAVYLARLTSRVDDAQGLTRLRHLRAGAAYVLGVLSALLWLSLVVPIPGAVAAWFGSVIIGAALLTSLPWRRARRMLSR